MASLDDGGALVITVTGVPATATEMFFSRTGPSGVPAFVRGYNPAQVPTGQTTMVVRDYEAPLGVPLVYTATYDVPGTFTVTVTVDHTDCEHWLVDLARPTNSQVLTIEQLAELAYQIPVGVHDILGRRAPIVTSDIANTPTFEVALLTDTDQDRDQARATLGNGVPVLLKTPPDQGIGNLYLSVLDWKEQRLATLGTVQARRFQISGVQVDRPDPALYVPIPPATYTAVKARFATYAALEAAYDTYDGLLYDYTGIGAVDNVAWPPRDV